MTTYYVDSNATGAGDGSSWANAFPTLLAAAAVWTEADSVLVASDHVGAYPSGATTILAPASPGLEITSVNKVTGVYEPGARESSTSSSGANYTLSGFVSTAGLSIWTAPASSSTNSIFLGSSASPSSAIYMRDGTLEIPGSNSNTSMGVWIGQALATTNDDSLVSLTNMGFRVFSAGQGTRARNVRLEMTDCYFVPSSTAPTDLFIVSAGLAPQVTCQGCDFSTLDGTLNFVRSSASAGPGSFTFVQCSLPPTIANAVSSDVGPGGPEVWFFDCEKAGERGAIGYGNSLGLCISSFATRVTAGLAGQSWLISTTALCGPATPFYTPFIDRYNTALGLVRPAIEMLRNDGNGTAYANNQVWADWAAPVTPSSIRTSQFTDAPAPQAASAPQAAGIGLGQWTMAAPNGAYSFKCDSGASFTPAVVGVIRGRIGVAVPNIARETLFVNPQQTGY